MFRLATIKTLQYHGALLDAINLARQVLDENSNNAELLALLGVLYCQQHQFEQGRNCLQQLQSLSDELNTELLTNIAAIHLLLKEPIPALAVLNQVLQQADFYLAHARRGLVLMQLGQYAEALIDLENALARSPSKQHAALHINIARCALHSANNEQALQHLEQAKQLGASGLEPWLFAAVDTYIALNRWDEAEHAIHQALDTGAAELTCVKLLALVLAAQDKHAQAAHCLRQALKTYPEELALLTQLAALARVQGHHGAVVRYIRAAIKIAPENASLWAQLAHSDKRQVAEQDAQRAAENALTLTENDTGVARAEALVAMASVSAEESQAEHYYRQALAVVRDYVPACLGLGHLLLQWGRIEEAVAQFESVSIQHPVAAYGALINARRFPDDPDILARIEKIAYLPSLQGAVSSSLLFDLAIAWEQRQDYSKAFQYLNQANAAVRKLLSYDAAQHSTQCLAIRRTFSRDFFEQCHDYGNQSSVPTFVLGMPRSGTTLVEQILGGHPDIFVAGEIALLSNTIQRLNAWERHIGSGQHYPDCVRDLTREQARHFAQEIVADCRHYAPHARHVVDKLPHNFEHIGLIRLLFPNAPIIHLLREPRDVAVSNYFIDYQAKFGGMGFAYDLHDIGKQLLDYQALMRHWDAVVVKPILTIRYEEVIADTEAAARKILAYLALDWTDAVLNYQQLERAVKTASVWQVRQPIYHSSTEKWRRYAEFLQPLEQVLNSPLTEDVLNTVHPNLPAGYFFQGMARLQANQAQQAADIFKTLLNHNPKHAAAQHMLAIAYYQQGQAEIALSLLQQAIAKQPRQPSWYANLSVVLNSLGKTTEAQAAYAKSQQLKTLQSEPDDFWQLIQ